jgi:hypothetical protein
MAGLNKYIETCRKTDDVPKIVIIKIAAVINFFISACSYFLFYYLQSAMTVPTFLTSALNSKKLVILGC